MGCYKNNRDWQWIIFGCDRFYFRYIWRRSGILVHDFHFRWWKIKHYRGENESLSSYPNTIIFSHLNWKSSWIKYFTKVLFYIPIVKYSCKGSIWLCIKLSETTNGNVCQLSSSWTPVPCWYNQSPWESNRWKCKIIKRKSRFRSFNFW